MKISFILMLSVASAVKINGVPSWDDGNTKRVANPLLNPSGIIVGDKIPEGTNPIQASAAAGEG